MPPAHALSIAGFEGKPVPNHFLREVDGSVRLAIFFPGRGYTCDMPLFYYAQNLLEGAGIDLLRVEYSYGSDPRFRNLEWDDQLKWLLADTAEGWRQGHEQGDYQSLTVVGTSLGTLAMGHLLTKDPRIADTRAIWLTPVLLNDQLRQQMQDFQGRSLIVIGTDDAHYDVAFLNSMRECPNVQVMVVEDADHGLDLAGDALGSTRILTDIVRALDLFLKAHHQPSLIDHILNGPDLSDLDLARDTSPMRDVDL